MNAVSRMRGDGFFAAVLARAETWLLEPPDVASGGSPGADQDEHDLAPAPPRPVVAVRGLAPRCGTTTVARALAAALARTDPAGVAIVAGPLPAPGARLATRPATRLARTVTALGCDTARPTGRICLIAAEEPLPPLLADLPAPLVIDLPHSSPPAEGLALADCVVLVADPSVEPSLVLAVETSLAQAGRVVEIAFTKVEDAEATLPGAVAIGDSRLAAQVALAGRDPRGPFAEPIAELARRCLRTASQREER